MFGEKKEDEKDEKEEVCPNMQNRQIDKKCERKKHWSQMIKVLLIRVLEKEH